MVVLCICIPPEPDPLPREMRACVGCLLFPPLRRDPGTGFSSMVVSAAPEGYSLVLSLFGLGLAFAVVYVIAVLRLGLRFINTLSVCCC